MAEYNPDAEYIQALEEERDDWARKHAAAESALASAQQELERRTAWSNEQMQKLGKQLADAEDKLAGCSESVEICHRQHEQCMKLLEKVRTHLAYHGSPESAPIARIIGEMLSEGELPEGWDQ